MTDLAPLRRALLSVSDKTGLVEFAQELALRKTEINCLLMSGHINQLPDDVAKNAQPFILQKPFDRTTLARALKAARTPEG